MIIIYVDLNLNIYRVDTISASARDKQRTTALSLVLIWGKQILRIFFSCLNILVLKQHQNFE